jgi:C1A family cysteine protease
MRSIHQTRSLIPTPSKPRRSLNAAATFVAEQLEARRLLSAAMTDPVPEIEVNPDVNHQPFAPPLIEPSTASASPTQPDLFPASYDLVTQDLVTPVENQGQYGTCWAFATYGSLESTILKEDGVTNDFSENNLAATCGFDGQPVDGGNSNMSEAYLSRGSGPVAASADPYSNMPDGNPTGTGTPSDPDAGAPAQYYIDEGTRLGNMTEIKTALMNWGAVYTAMYWQDASYNSSTDTYYYNGDAGTNHAVTIVGWNDSESVPGAPAAGAWLIKNSWGSDWGDSGYFWLSYCDTEGGLTGECFHDAVSPYSQVYYYDEFGDVSELNTPYAFNAFTATSNQELDAVQFWSEAENASYTISVYSTYSGGSLSGLLSATSGTEAYAGYHTAALPAPVPLTTGQHFYVEFSITNGGTYPMAVDFACPGYDPTSTASPSQSYYSFDGSNWGDLTTWNSTAAFCIKALATTSAATTTTLVNNGSSVSNNTQSLSYAAAVTPGVPNGESVLLEDASNGNAVVATATLSSGTATFTVGAGALSVGTHNLFAVYGGDATFSASQSTTIAQTINPLAVQSGSTLDVNLSRGAAVTVSPASGGGVAISQQGAQLTFTGITGLNITDTCSNDVLNLNGPLSPLFRFVNCGSSTVNVNSCSPTVSAAFNIGALTVNGGTLRLAACSGGSSVTSLTIAGSSALDLANNSLLVDYGSNSDPRTAILQSLASGYNGGSWTGAGIDSSIAAVSKGVYGIGFADGADGVVQGLSSGQIELKYTLIGDANLDGVVNGEDFTILARNFNQSVTGWDQGDFNYDGVVNGEDFTLLAANFNQEVNLNAPGLVAGSGAIYTITGSTGAQTLDILSGTVTLTSDLSALLPNYSLQIQTGASAVLASDQHIGALQLVGSGTLDVSDYTMFIHYGSNPDPISTIAGYIKSGYNGGGWNGQGIISTAAQTPANGLHYGLGYADSADRGNPAGLSSGQIEVMYTLLGDANLDGTVNGEDFTILAANFNQSATGWDQGDFNYDGVVNGEDFTLLSANFNQQANLAADANAPAAAAPVVVSATPTVATVTTKSTAAPLTTPKSKAVITGTTNSKAKARAVTAYAARVVAAPSTGSTALAAGGTMAVPQNINKDAKFLADR